MFAFYSVIIQPIHFNTDHNKKGLSFLKILILLIPSMNSDEKAKTLFNTQITEQ